jgi:hypothetical protein
MDKYINNINFSLTKEFFLSTNEREVFGQLMYLIDR